MTARASDLLLAFIVILVIVFGATSPAYLGVGIAVFCQSLFGGAVSNKWFLIWSWAAEWIAEEPVYFSDGILNV